MQEIEENGLEIGDYIASPQEAFDALMYRFIIPIYVSSEFSGKGIYFKYWSPLAHTYCDFDDFDLLEEHWYFSILTNTVWSYN
jgi:4'-phosphopantetheinyl transferase EntD